MSRARRWLALCLPLAACGGGGGGGCPVSTPQADCSFSGTCAAIPIVGEAPHNNPGTFKGYADPVVLADPGVPGRLWLGYSWPHVIPGQDPGGNTVQLAAVQNRLARSDNGGLVYSFEQVLWPDVAAADPEGSGETGRISSETASFATITTTGVTTWYGAHLRYFLRPITGYNPNYATSWTVRVTAAASPAGLATAPEAVLGVTNTHAAWAPNARLDQIAGLPVPHCAMLNNPTLFARGQTLYLVVECLAFIGTTPDYANTSMQVFATEPVGAPTAWTWRHSGELADAAIAAELGADTILQPDVSLADDGTPIALITPAHADAASPVGTTGDGCVALELESIDPPQLARDCHGDLIVRTRVTGLGVGACTHDRNAATGVIATSQGASGGNWQIRASNLDP